MWGVVGVCLLAVTLWAGQRGRPIQFSPPRDETVTTNLNELNSKTLQDELLRWKLLEDSIGKGPMFKPTDSLGGVPVLPRAPVVVSPGARQRAKELQERRKNWAFADPEEATRLEALLQEWFGPAKSEENELEKKDQSPVVQFYERLQRERRVGQRADGADGETAAEKRFQEFDPTSPLGQAILQFESQLEALRAPEVGSPFSVSTLDKSVFTDIFGAAAAPAKRTPIQEARMSEFKKLLERATPAGSVTPPTPLAGYDRLAAPGTPLADSVGLGAGGQNLSTGLRSAAPPTPNFATPGWRSTTPLLPARPARPPTIPPPVTPLPKRNF